ISSIPRRILAKALPSVSTTGPLNFGPLPSGGCRFSARIQFPIRPSECSARAAQVHLPRCPPRILQTNLHNDSSLNSYKVVGYSGKLSRLVLSMSVWRAYDGAPSWGEMRSLVAVSRGQALVEFAMTIAV